MIRRTLPFIVVLALLAGPAAAQAPDGWRLSLGAGPAVLVSGHDQSVEGQTTTGVRVALDRGLMPRLAVGAEWLATWPMSTYVNENRHHVGLTATVFPFGSGLAFHTGLGLGTATIVTVDGPPRDGVGDVDIGIGDNMGPGGTAGLSWDLYMGGGITLTPTVHGLVQQIQGFTLTHAFFGVRLGAG